MEELLGRITQKTGLDAATAQRAVGIILAYLRKEGPPDAVNRLLAAMPGSEDVIAQSGDGGPGGLMGGGGGMALGTKLMGAGVGMHQMEPLGRELFDYGREKAGEDTMGEIVGAIP